MSTVDDSENLSSQISNLITSYISENDPESTVIDFLSIFDFWGHMHEGSMFMYGTPRAQRAHF